MHYSVSVGTIGDITSSLYAFTVELTRQRFNDDTVLRSGLIAGEFAWGKHDSRLPLAPQRVITVIDAAMVCSEVVPLDIGVNKM